MNTINGLFDEIASVDNIISAIENASRHKTHKRIVQMALKNKEQLAIQISNLLISGEWKPKQIHVVKVINDGISRKKREIVCPDFICEHIIHHAIIQVVKPYLMNRFYRYSCASIPDRGTEFAISYIRKITNDDKNTKYFVKTDIKNFFNSIKPSKVFHALRRIFRDKKLLKLFAMILRANKVKMPDGTIIKRGTPIGLYTSPWFANILLTQLDNKIKENIKYYVRYNDDMLLFCSNKRKLKHTVDTMNTYVKSIGLKLKNNPQIHLFKKNVINFIGIKIRPNRITLSSKLFLRARRVATRISKKERITIYDARRMLSYSGKFSHTNTRIAYREYIESKVPKRKCRKIISKGDKKKHVAKIILNRQTA